MKSQVYESLTDLGKGEVEELLCKEQEAGRRVTIPTDERCLQLCLSRLPIGGTAIITLPEGEACKDLSIAEGFGPNWQSSKLPEATYL